MKTLQELKQIREAMKAKINNRSEAGENDIRIVVGMATCGIAAGARDVLTAFLQEVDSRKLDNVRISQTGCIGHCALEPIVEVTLPGQNTITYISMSAAKAAQVVASHVVNGIPIQEYALQEEEK